LRRLLQTTRLVLAVSDNHTPSVASFWERVNICCSCLSHFGSAHTSVSLSCSGSAHTSVNLACLVLEVRTFLLVLPRFGSEHISVTRPLGDAAGAITLWNEKSLPSSVHHQVYVRQMWMLLLRLSCIYL
jgi:hypothetical protein